MLHSRYHHISKLNRERFIDMDSGHYYGNAPNKSIAMQDTWYFDERRSTNAKIAYIAITSSCCSAYLHIIVVHFFFQFNFFKVQIRILPTYMLKCSYCYWSTSAVKHHHNKDFAFLNYLNLPHLLNMKFMSNNWWNNEPRGPFFFCSWVVGFWVRYLQTTK